MKLWKEWYSCVRIFQAACTRERTFLFWVMVLVGFSIRQDLAGVSSFIRAVGFDPTLYRGFLHFFCYSTGWYVDSLTQIWIRMVHEQFPGLTVKGYRIYVADGLNVAKEGRKMPAVKKLRQSSENSNKAESIMGHSLQGSACWWDCQTALPLRFR